MLVVPTGLGSGCDSGTVIQVPRPMSDAPRPSATPSEFNVVAEVAALILGGLFLTAVAVLGVLFYTAFEGIG